MASQKKKQTTGKSTGKQGRGKKDVVIEEDPGSGFLRGEVMVIGSFALAVLLFLSNFHLCGVAGDFLRGIQLGIFGWVGFLAPLLIFVGTAFYMSNQGNPVAVRKLVASVAAVLVVCAFSQFLFGSELQEGEGLLAYYAISSEHGRAGGLVGGVVLGVLESLVGTVGSMVVLLVLLIISTVCITERSFVKAVKARGGYVYRQAREDIGRRREINAERREEQRHRLESQRVRGVNLSSTDLSMGNNQKEAGMEGAGAEETETDRYAGPEDQGDESAAGRAAVPRRGHRPGKQEPDAANVENAAARADVFTGTISMAQGSREPEPDEDMAPFDEEPVLGMEESAQRLVEEGISHLEDPDAVFAGRELPMAEDLNHIREIPVFGETALGDEKPWPDGAEKPDIPSVQMGYAQHDSFADDQKAEAYSPEVTMPPQSADTFGLEEEEIFLEEPEKRPEEMPLEMPAAGTSDEGYTKTTENGGTFYVPGGERRVETAGGKIIETDTQMLQKRLESRRREVREAGGAAGVQAELKAREEQPKKEYIFPPLNLLKRGRKDTSGNSEQEYRETAIKLQKTLQTFGVGVTVTNISCGPTVTRYELHPEMGVKVSKIVGLADDIKLSLAAADIRIEAPIPGKSAVGIEVPNKENTIVYLRDLLEAENFQNHPSRLAFAVGKDIGGQTVVADIAKMPHLLIAGATGAGKSVCINTLIMSIIYKSKPDEVKMILVDPKVVELSIYNGIPHLLIPVVTDPKKAAGALNWAVAEMTDRYKKFAKCNARDLKGYNAKVENIKDVADDKKPQKMPQIVIIIDELADLMMVASNEVEDAICRLAQLARACGIHLVIATQRPSVNVITGLIKANVPSRIAFSVSSSVDSRTILDMTGAEKLIGKGDMLFYPAGYPKPQRAQGAFVSDSEVQAVVDYLTEQGGGVDYNMEIEKQVSGAASVSDSAPKNSRDEYFEEAGRFIIEKDKASIGMLQRMFKIGFNRAARIMDQLAQAGIVGEEEGTKPRKILMTMEEFEELLEQGE